MTTETQHPRRSIYPLAWAFYLVLALAGVVWIGLARRGIPLDLFVDRTGWWLDLLLGAAGGLTLLASWLALRRIAPSAERLEARLAELLGRLTPSEAVVLALLSGFAEELFFRGAMQGSWGLLPATLIFAILHTGPEPAFRLWTLFALVAGLLLGGLAAWRGNLLAPITAHALVNGINLWRIARQPEVVAGRADRPG